MIPYLDIRWAQCNNNQKELLEIGTCCIHSVHCAFKHDGVPSGWSIDKVLSAMYKIFDQSPSRRADYERLTDGVYPLQFCSHLWAENEKVAVRAIAVWENIQIVVISG